MVYLPFFAGKLSLADLFSAHNEHRIFFTRIYGLALLLLNGQWDGQLQMVGNAIIHCAVMAGLGWLMFRWLERRYWISVWLPLVLVLALPFGWENSLAGFQSQFYFLVAFSLLTLWLPGLHPPGSARWWCGAATAIMALFTVASGFLAAAAALALVVLRIWRRPKTWKQQALTLVFCSAVAAAGVLLKADVRHHHLLQAHSAGEFLAAFGANLAWPWIVVPPWQSRLPYLEISVAGDLDEQNLSLELVNLATGEQTTVKPSRIAGSKWLSCYVKAPASEFKNVARDASETAWFAFKAPREVGRLSFWAIQTLNAWKYLLFAGSGLFLFNLAVLPARRSSADV